MNTKYFNCIFSRFTHSIPQSATLTPFRSPIPAISHLDLLGLRPEKKEKA